ncbi:DNA helicase related protein [Desulfosporosinus sp. I2]|nr:DNA helicase related protein [Desulfosporosinus sp. I2]
MFKKRFYRLWLDAILPKYPAVLNFRRRVQERTIDEFVYLDKLQFDIAKARIKKKLIDALPSFSRVTSGVDELNILKRELGKQRRIMPIRKLFRAIPNLLLTLKPCLMMSPLSVSLFLEAESYNFDTIIFDEASQVCTENAIGAISRGKQVIIAGDSKQLPPTNFFNASTSDTEFDNDDSDDEYDDTNAYESILDEAGLLTERTLLWHYRSRHEHLIAFSNAKIYKNNLITFPANADKLPDNGVEYVYVAEGFYDRGGKKGNVIEAKRVAELVFEHFKRFPNRTLGVITFGEVQQQAIDTVLRQMRKENQRLETFFNEDNEEAFFVKNLENVQGDERDTIIFGIGYAKDASGKFVMNFGPLSKVGGERRLNVAITRAKHNVKLVGSILPTDIDTERISAEGPKLLRSYIDFAINGPSVILGETTESDIAEHDSPFEVAVYNFLDRKGYNLGTQVGCSGYRIDMAVKHPSKYGRYVIGIECDGAAYHSARTARERDRLRQAVLEDMGWKIYRIWSTDWIKDPITEGQKLLEAVENAISEYVENTDDYFQVTPPIVEDNVFLRIDKDSNPEDNINPYAFEYQGDTNFGDLPHDSYGYLNIGDCINAAVKNEYPLHYELLCKKVAPLFGNEKATVKIRREVDYALSSLREVIRKGDFLYPAGYTKVIPKAAGNTRPIIYISQDEIAEAMLVIVSNSYGIMRDSLFQATAREYRFARSGERIQTSLQQAYELLLKSGRVKELDGKVVMP